MQDYQFQTKFPNKLMKNSIKEYSRLQPSPFNRNLFNLPVCAISSNYNSITWNFAQSNTVKRWCSEIFLRRQKSCECNRENCTKSSIMVTYLSWKKCHVFHICKIFRNCPGESNHFQECDNPEHSKFLHYLVSYFWFFAKSFQDVHISTDLVINQHLVSLSVHGNLIFDNLEEPIIF